MSIHLMSLAWEIKFPTHVQKLVMLKLADHASDDGESVFPAVGSLAYQIGCDERSVQRSTRALEGCGLIRRVHTGGSGPRDTNRFEIDVDLLIKCAVGEIVIEGSSAEIVAVENKGDTVPPSAIRRVARVLKRVTPVSPLRVTPTPPKPSLEPPIEPPTRASAREGGDISDLEVKGSKPPGRRPIASFVIRRGDAQWQAWIATLSERDATLAAGAEASGEIIALGSKWPDQAEWPPIVHTKELTRQSRRMAGERV